MYSLSRVERERRERMLRDFKLGVFSAFVLVILVVSFCWDRQTAPEPARPAPSSTQSVQFAFQPPSTQGQAPQGQVPAAISSQGQLQRARPESAAREETIQGSRPDSEPQPEPEVRVIRYRIRRNDTLVKLARRYYAGDWTKWTLIRDANPGIRPRRLWVGRVIKIPVPVRRETCTLAARDGARRRRR